MKAKQKSKKQAKKTAKFKPKTLMENAHDIYSSGIILRLFYRRLNGIFKGGLGALGCSTDWRDRA